MTFSTFAILTIGFFLIGATSHFLGKGLPELWWKSLEVVVVITGFVAVLAALSQISLARFERNISDTVIEAQTDFRRIERVAERGLMSCRLWWDDVASWEYVPPNATCVKEAGGEPTSCAVCRIVHMVYQERNTSFGLASEGSQALDRGDFLRSNFCHESLTAPEYKSICPSVSKYSDTVSFLQKSYEVARTDWLFRFGRSIDPWLQYVFMVILGLELGKIITDIRRPVRQENQRNV